MKGLPSLLVLAGMILLAVLGGRALNAADKDTVKVPEGLAMAEFKGYEDGSVVATSQTEEPMKVMVANPIMIAAFKSGIPLNGSLSRSGAPAELTGRPGRRPMRARKKTAKGEENVRHSDLRPLRGSPVRPDDS